MWIAVGLLTLLFIYLMKRKPAERNESANDDRPRVKITVVKKGESALSTLKDSPSSSTKAVHIADKELEEWLEKNPALREANKR